MIVVGEKCGQLGNRLLLSAHLLAFSDKFGPAIYLSSLEDYRHLFAPESPAGRLWYDSRNRNARGVAERAVVTFLPYTVANLTARAARRMCLTRGPLRLVATGGEGPESDVDPSKEPVQGMLSRRGICMTLGWRFRCYDLFHERADLIRASFPPAREVRKAVEATITTARRNNNVLVGVHIRQGDYAEFLGGRFCLSTSDYVSRMQAVVELFPGRTVGFLVCSDAVQDPTTFGSLPVTLGPGGVGSDLFALASCDFIIGVPSTYSRWASFYGRVPIFTIEEGPPENINKFKPASH